MDSRPTRRGLLTAIIVLVTGCGGGGGPLDAGTVDAGVADAGPSGDGAPDAPGSDGGNDLGTPDAGCTTDADGDGHRSIACGGDDCDDADPNRYPGNTEVCDAGGHDEDCNPATLGPDLDGDGFVSAMCCNRQPGGELLCGTDCDDTSASVNPAAPEVCDGIDDNCNGLVDEGVLLTFYRDADGDGFGLDSMTRTGCSLLSGYSFTGGDCNDMNPAVHPGATEVCNGIDDNCDGTVDEGVTTSCYTDADGDGYAPMGATARTVCGACMATETTNAPTGTMIDCDDTRATVHPGAMELCDGRDTDCTSGTSMAVPAEDADGDMHTAVGFAGCTGGYPKDDCADWEPNAFPGQTAYFPTGYCPAGSNLCAACGLCVASGGSCSASCMPIVTPTFDYDCDGAQSPQPSGTNSCVNGGSCFAAPGCDTPHYYYTVTPACGASTTYWPCGCGAVSCLGGPASTRGMACR